MSTYSDHDEIPEKMLVRYAEIPATRRGRRRYIECLIEFSNCRIVVGQGQTRLEAREQALKNAEELKKC